MWLTSIGFLCVGNSNRHIPSYAAQESSAKEVFLDGVVVEDLEGAVEVVSVSVSVVSMAVAAPCCSTVDFGVVGLEVFFPL